MKYEKGDILVSSIVGVEIEIIDISKDGHEYDYMYLTTNDKPYIIYTTRTSYIDDYYNYSPIYLREKKLKKILNEI